MFFRPWRRKVIRSFTELGLTILTFFYCAASTYYVFEKFLGNPITKTGNPYAGVLPFHECIYFIVVTCTTVGYGDISPTSVPSMFLVMFLILAGFSFLPVQVNKILELLREKKPYTSRMLCALCGDF